MKVEVSPKRTKEQMQSDEPIRLKNNFETERKRASRLKLEADHQMQ